jgi:uncharacterized protein
MPPIVSAKKMEIEVACRQFGVARLDVFGSAASGTFDTAKSDLDFLVSFGQKARAKAFDNYFGLREKLEEIFGRPIDLVTSASVKNPYLLREIEAQRQTVYVAQA